MPRDRKLRNSKARDTGTIRDSQQVGHRQRLRNANAAADKFWEKQKQGA